MATCISCDKRYYLDNPGCTLRFCTQECLRSYTCDHIRPGWAGDINEVFEERDRLREEIKELTSTKETATTITQPKFQSQNFITIFRKGVSSELACARWTDGDHRAYFHGQSFIGSKEYIAAEVQKIIAEQEKAGWTDQQIFPYPAPDDEEP